MWQQWVNFAVGLWIIASGYLGFTPDAMATNVTLSGLIVAALGLWGALAHTTVETYDTTHMHA